MYITFNNQSATVASFSIQWNGGETLRSGELATGQSYTFNGALLNIPLGTSCWGRAYIEAGPNHDSGDNFIFTNDESTVTYTLTGTTFGPSFSCQGCQ